MSPLPTPGCTLCNLKKWDTMSLSEINLPQTENYPSPGNHTHDCHASFQPPGSLLTNVERKLMMKSPFSRAAQPKGTC